MNLYILYFYKFYNSHIKKNKIFTILYHFFKVQNKNFI